MTLSLRLQSTDRSFERLYRAHVGDVYRYALAVTGNVADAEDVAQTTFMNAYRALERGERPVKPRHWLIAIAHNVCRQRFRQSARRPAEVVYEEDIAEALVPSDDAPTAADIQRALGQLALNQREALVMRELEGRSYADIAELLGLSVTAVETLLFRARRALREQLEGSLSCSEAEAALSLQLDGHLGRSDAALLRSHLRACESCHLLARRQRAQRKSLKTLALVPLPSGLTSWFGGGGAAVGVAGAGAANAGLAGLGSALTAKVAAVGVAAAVVVGGGSYAVIRHETAGHPRRPQRRQAYRRRGRRAERLTSSSPRAHSPNRARHGLTGSDPAHRLAALDSRRHICLRPPPRTPSSIPRTRRSPLQPRSPRHPSTRRRPSPQGDPVGAQVEEVGPEKPGRPAHRTSCRPPPNRAKPARR